MHSMYTMISFLFYRSRVIWATLIPSIRSNTANTKSDPLNKSSVRPIQEGWQHVMEPFSRSLETFSIKIWSVLSSYRYSRTRRSTKIFKNIPEMLLQERKTCLRSAHLCCFAAAMVALINYSAWIAQAWTGQCNQLRCRQLPRLFVAPVIQYC